jgi:hypothetical protein
VLRWTVPGRIPRNRRYQLLLAAGSVLIALALLAAAPIRDQGSSGSAHEAHSVHGASSAIGHGAQAPARPGQVTPAQATLQLQALIGQHSILSAEMMRGRLRGDEDFAQAANAAVGKNTEALGQLVGSLFGAEAQQQFASLWSTHVTYLFNYARGLADRDDALRNQSRTELAVYESDLAKFFAAASKGRLPQGSAETGLHAHVHQLLDQADAYAAKDYTKSAKLYRESYAHSFELGTAVAGGLLGSSAAESLKAPQWRLQSQLGRLLGEHVALVVTAVRAGAANSDDFSASAEALNGNTRELAGAVDSLYGAAAAKRFQTLWADHIDQVVSYTVAVSTGDATRRQDALAKLDKFQRDLATFLATATQGRLASPGLTQAFLMHDRMLVRIVDAWRTKEYQQAHDIAYDAYQQMFDLAGQLSNAIGATIASRMPRGGAQTGGGGMAAVVGRR